MATAPAYPGRRLSGRVVELAPEAEMKPDVAIRTRIARVKIRVLERAALLRPGLEVDVEGESTVAASAVLVPSDALVLRDNKTAVFFVKRQIARLREIRVGYTSFDLTEVLSRVTPSEMVVVRRKDGLCATPTSRSGGASSWSFSVPAGLARRRS